MKEQYQLHADKVAQQFGLNPKLFRAVIQQESEWEVDAESRRGARGLGQIMPDTGQQPGYGIPPLQDDSWQENLRFSAQYLAKMRELTGDDARALAAYNAGYGNVLKHKGIPPFAETQDYVRRILGNVEAATTGASMPVTNILQRRQQSIEEQVAAVPVAPRQDTGVMAGQQELAMEPAAPQPQTGFLHATEHGGALYQGFRRHLRNVRDPDFQLDRMKSITDLQERRLPHDERMLGYLWQAKSKEEYDRSLKTIERWQKDAQRVAQSGGWSKASNIAGMLVTESTDPVAFTVAIGTLGLGRVLGGYNLINRSRKAQMAILGAESGAANVVVEALIQDLNFGQVRPGDLVIAAALGTTIGVAFTPGIMHRGFRARRSTTELDALTGQLERAIEDGAEQAVITQLMRNIDDARVSLMDGYIRDGDAMAAEAWRQAGPGASAQDVADAIGNLRRVRSESAEMRLGNNTDLRTARDQGLLESVEPPRTRAEEIAQAVRGAGEGATGVRGIRLDSNASIYYNYAHKVWREDVDASLQDMHAKMKQWYDFRQDKLKGYVGLSGWLDSPSLVLARSDSKVARMVSSHLFESATGLNRGESSAAIKYEVLHQHLMHRHIPQMKALLHEWMGAKDKWGHILFGGGVNAEKSFWRVVALERLKRRKAIAENTEYVADQAVPVQVREAAGLLDSFWKDAADNMKDAGLPEGAGILGGGFVGHTPYNWDWQKIRADFNSNPEVFDAFRGLMREQFADKITGDIFSRLQQSGAKAQEAKKSGLRTRVSDLSDQITALEKEIAADAAAERAAADADGIKTPADEAAAAREGGANAADAARYEADTAAGRGGLGSTELPTIQIPRTLGGGAGGPKFKHETGRTTLGELARSLEEHTGLTMEERALGRALLADIGTTDATTVVFVAKTAASDPIPLGPDTRGLYSPTNDLLVTHGDPAKGLTPADTLTLFHEIAHERTAHYLLADPATLSPEAAAGRQSILDGHAAYSRWYRGFIKTGEWKGLSGYQKHHIKYAAKSPDEFASQLFNSKDARARYKTVLLDGNRSVLRGAWEGVLRLVGIKPGERVTAYVKAIEGIAALANRKADFAYIGGVVQHRAKAAPKKAVSPKAKRLATLKAQRTKARNELKKAESDPLGDWGKMVQQLQRDVTAKSDALTSNYIKRVMSSPDERARQRVLHFADLARDLLDENWRGENLSDDVIKQFRDLLQEKVSDRSRTEFDLLATKNVNGKEVSLLDYLSTDGLAMVKTQGHITAGRVALAKSGFMDDFDIDGAIRAAELDGASRVEIEQLRFGFDFFSGQLASNDHPGVHAIRNLTFAARMGKLGISQLADITQVASTLGTANMLRVMGDMGKQVLDGSLFVSKEGNLTELGAQLARDLPGVMGKNHRLMTLIPDDGITGKAEEVASNFLTRVSLRGAQMVAYLGLANGVSMAMHRAVTPIMVEEMLSAIRTGTSAINVGRLTDAGMSPEWVARVKAQMDKHDSGRKRGSKVHWDKWDDQAAASQLIESIHRAVYQTLQKGLVGEKTSWMSTSPIGRVVGQFRSFGFTASEKIVARNLGHGDSGTASLFVLGAAWASLLYYARVHLNAIGKPPAEKEKYIEEATSGIRLTRGILTLWNASGILPDGVALGGLLLGSNPMGTADPAAGLGYLRDVSKAAAAPVELITGEADGSTAAKAFKVLPGANTIPGTILQNLMNQ